jgi:hypothetical protein
MSEFITTTAIPAAHILEYMRASNKHLPQYKGIWYEYRPRKRTDPLDQMSVWKLEDEDGYAMFFNAHFYRIDQCFELFREKKATDPDWNYATVKNRP